MDSETIFPEAEDQLSVRVAWLYYNEELTQAEIGKRLGITRARVNRILQSCRESGLVQVRINSNLSACVALERRLEQTYGLVQAMVVPTPPKEAKLYDALGRTVGEFISTILRDGQSLGLGWGKTLRTAIKGIEPRSYSNISIISLFGGLPRSATTNPYDIASLFARRLDASECYYIAAPMYVSSREVRDTLMSQELFSIVFERAMQVDLALIGAGDLTAKSTNVVLGALTEDEWKSLLKAGAVGEIFGHFLDEQGGLVDHPLNDRIMGPDFDKLLAIPHIVVASGGVQKAPILRAVLRRGCIHTLVTDEATAERILDNGRRA